MTQEGERMVAKDPVCGMEAASQGNYQAVFRGQEFQFCSQYCRTLFLEDPSRYVPERSGAPNEPGGEGLSARRIAYFSMEVGIEERVPVYSGGLGVLAGDMLRSFADLKVPAVGVSLLYRKGYFKQTLDAAGNQQEHPVEWRPEEALRRLTARTQLTIGGRPVAVAAWQYDVGGPTAPTVPLILLDTELPENSEVDRELTRLLYGGDERYRLAQEVVLGVGGVRMLRALGYTGIERYHMNEGHASLLALELLAEQSGSETLARKIEAVKKRCIFTTHTPVPAGHDRFSYDLVRSVLGEPVPLEELKMLGGEGELNMTLLALNLSRYVNGVAERNAAVSRKMFPGYSIEAISNGVHAFTWTSGSFRELYDKRIPGWARAPSSLRHAIKLPRDEVWSAHLAGKARLLDAVRQKAGVELAADALTIGFARRATAYKRADLVFRDVKRVAAVSRTVGRLQFVFAGKAHPRDEEGKELIRRIFRAADALKADVQVVYLENYDLDLARILTSGADLWLNTPLRPLEASGTSGMKAALNGVPSLSILDGWWIEGHVEGVTGWSIGSELGEEIPETRDVDVRDSTELYDKLEKVIVPLYYRNRGAWIDVMRRAIAFNGSFFNAHRMVEQYAVNAYL
jgi:glycogen phosphorylase